MEDKKEEQDKPEKKVEAPPRINDPKLAETIKFTDKPTKKTIINIKKEDL